MDTVRLEFCQRSPERAPLLSPRQTARLWRWLLCWSLVLLWGMSGLVSPAFATTERIEVAYNRGIVEYDEGNYPEALILFREVIAQHPDNADAHFYLGLTLIRTARFEEGITAIQEALKLNMQLDYAHYHLGLAYFKVERYQEALQEFRLAEKFDPDNLTTQRYLDALQKLTRDQQLFQVQGSVSFQYDDNVILEPNDAALAFGEQADGRMVFALDARLTPVRTPRLRLGVGYQWYQSVHFELSEFDVRSHTVGGFARFKMTDRVALGLDINYAFTLLDNDPFSAGLSVIPSATIRQTDALFAVASVQYRLDYFQNQLIPPGQGDVRDRDGWGVRSGLAQYLVFNRKRSYVRASYHFDAQRNEGSDWEYNGHDIGIGLQTLLWPKLTLNLDGSYSHRSYLHINSFDADPVSFLDNDDQDERRDDRLTGGVSVKWEFKPYLSMSAGYTHTSNISNIPFFDYRRNMITFAFTGRY